MNAPLALLVASFVLALAGPAEAGRGRKGPPTPEQEEALEQIREGSLKPGDLPPTVQVVDLEGAERSLLTPGPRERPLVLVFGSFT
ncbi:MAG: hypothetical protein R3F59_12210 [Myxococcota bacterium]